MPTACWLGRHRRRCLCQRDGRSLVDAYKTELIADRVWRTRRQIELATVAWVGWYNARRLHGELGDVPPVEYELAHALTVPSAPARADDTPTTVLSTK